MTLRPVSPSQGPRARAKRPRTGAGASPSASSEEYDLCLGSLVRAPASLSSDANREDGTPQSVAQRLKKSGKGSKAIPLSESEQPLIAPPRKRPELCPIADNCPIAKRASLVRVNHENSTADGDLFLLRGPENHSVAFAGSVEIEVLRGAVSVLSHTLTSRTPPTVLHSAPLGPFLVTLSPTGSERKLSERGTLPSEIEAALLEYVPVFTSEEQPMLYSLFRLRPLHDGYNLAKHVAPFFSELPIPQISDSSASGQKLVEGCQLAVGDARHSAFCGWDQWDSVTSSLELWRNRNTELPLRIVVVGDGGTGKSMLARCLVNHLLSLYGAVVFVETDVGQPELTPPGLLSAVEVTSPLLGPPASHNKSVPFAASFFGEVSPREHMSSYASSVSRVIATARNHASDREVPLICNSDGWVSGAGAELLRHLVGQLEPSHCFGTAFRSSECGPQSSPSKEETTASAMGSASDELMYSADVRSVLEQFDPDQRVVLTSPRISKGQSFPASLLREMSIMAYFAEALGSGQTRCVSLEDVNLSFVGEGVPPTHVLAALNGSVVALAVTEGAVAGTLWNVRGLGIVRGIEEASLTLHIATPVPDKVLEECDGILMSGGLNTPAGIFFAMAAAGAEKSGDDNNEYLASTPYIVKGVLGNADSMKSRSTLMRR